MKQEALRKAQPLAAYLELTYSCNWRCVFCYNPRHYDFRRMSASEWNVVVEDLRNLGALTVTLTGGEPLAHPEFFEIAETARRLFLAVRIFTNGALIDDVAAAKIASLYPQAVELSIHGATAATHDLTTSRPGSFVAMWRAIDLLKEHGVRVFLKTPLTSLNEHELEALVALVLSKNLPLNIDPSLTPRDDGDRSPLAYAPSHEALQRLMRLDGVAHSLKKVTREAGAVNCGLGRITLAVDPEGNVFPCIQWRTSSLGNVRTTRLVDMWANSESRRNAADVAVQANTALMDSRSVVADFPFCPAVAMQRSGSPLVPDETMIRQASLASDLLRDVKP